MFEGVFKPSNEESQPGESTTEKIDRSPEAFEAARELAAEHPLLKHNAALNKLFENNFVTPSGKELDPGNFLAEMLAYLEGSAGEEITPSQLTGKVENLMVQHSKSWQDKED